MTAIGRESDEGLEKATLTAEDAVKLLPNFSSEQLLHVARTALVLLHSRRKRLD
jgi:hypothetical protein